MSQLSKINIEAILLFQSLINNNSIYQVKDNNKKIINNENPCFYENITLNFLSNFFISRESEANKSLYSFFQQNENKDIPLVDLFQICSMIYLSKNGISYRDEAIKEIEIQLMAEITMYFETVSFSDIQNFTFQEEDIILFNSDVEIRGELIKEQMYLINEFNLDDDMNDFLINILFNKDKYLTILFEDNKNTYEIKSLSKGAFVGYKISDIQDLLISLYKVNISGGIIFVKEFRGLNKNSFPTYDFYAYSVFKKKITAFTKEELIDNFPFDMILGEALQQEELFSYIDSPFEV